MNDKLEDMKFDAILHGADPKEFKEGKKSSGDMLFKDPAEYDNMTEKERKELSDKMKSQLMRWSGAKRNG